MKDLFLNYEDSLFMKEKGFDEECFGFYDQYKKLIISYSIQLNILNNEIAAPLHSQAVQWILKKAELKYPYLSITIYSDGSGHWCDDGISVLLTSDDKVFNSPSECIREGIKLI